MSRSDSSSGPSVRSTAVRVGRAALLAGGLDLIYAFGVNGANHVPPVRVLQYIASGLIGPAAFQGGAATAALRGLVHFGLWGLFAASAVLGARTNGPGGAGRPPLPGRRGVPGARRPLPFRTDGSVRGLGGPGRRPEPPGPAPLGFVRRGGGAGALWRHDPRHRPTLPNARPAADAAGADDPGAPRACRPRRAGGRHDCGRRARPGSVGRFEPVLGDRRKRAGRRGAFGIRAPREASRGRRNHRVSPESVGAPGSSGARSDHPHRLRHADVGGSSCHDAAPPDGCGTKWATRSNLAARVLRKGRVRPPRTWPSDRSRTVDPEHRRSRDRCWPGRRGPRSGAARR